jgi:hypothetical protein
MTPRNFIKILIVVIIIGAVAFGIWYALNYFANQQPATGETGSTTFTPLNRPGSGNITGNGQGATSTSTGSIIVATSTVITTPIPVLRLLSDTPIGGYGASTTASTTIVKWVDRGRGNIYEARSNTLDIVTLSNTLVPRIYQSSWNKDLTAFIGSILPESGNDSNTVFAQLVLRPVVKTATSTTKSDLTAYELKGRNLPANTLAYAVSPKKDRVFIFVQEGSNSSGYVANIDGSRLTQIFTTPLSQINVEWPSDNIITITTKGSATQDGFLYFVNPQSGAWTKILGPARGLSTKTSHDGTRVAFSAAGGNNDTTVNIYNVTKNTSSNDVIRTLVDKCVWGNFYKDILYCASPFQTVSGTYPDDWYTGALQTIDKIWQTNATTGEVHLVANLIGQAGRIIDGFNLGLDDKDNFLFFMNKYDLSFWSLNLVKSN